jgi:5'-3' exonuclease
MQEIYNHLASPDYKTTLYEICTNLKDIIISSSYEFGEGEKKIMEEILHEKKEGSYVIFSPDSDVVLLSLLMQNKLYKLNIINAKNSELNYKCSRCRTLKAIVHFGYSKNGSFYKLYFTNNKT